MVLSRRGFLAAGIAVPAWLHGPAGAQPAPTPRGPLGHLGLDASQFGLRPGASEDQTQRLQTALAEAAKRNAPLLLPPGRYRLGTVRLPDGAQIVGVAGETRLVTASGGPLLAAGHIRSLRLTGLAFDGLDIPSPQRAGLVDGDTVGEVTITDCDFAKAGSVGLTLRRCGGRITTSRFRGMRDSALFSLDSTGLAIERNDIEDCGNNGIQIWRGQAGDDLSILRGNRLSRIRADAGGDGPNGNGISLYRAGGVIIEGNQLRDCAMTFIRNNSGSGVQMLGNQGRRCGETALYSEFAFEGAIIANNLIEDCAQGANITNLDHGGRLAIFANNIIRNVKRGIAPNGKEPIGGLGVHIEAEAAVTGNVIENVSEAGISLGWAWAMRNLVATGNVVRQCGIGISVSLVPKERNALIANNVIDQARNGAIVGTEYGRPVTGDLSKAPDARAAGIRIENNAVR